MAWTTPRTWVTSEVVTASIMNTHVRDNFDETGPAVATSAAGFLMSGGTNSVVERPADGSSVTTLQSTTSTSYTDLTTSGPAVTLTTGTRVIVAIVARINNNTLGNVSYMSYAISGATTSSATDNISAHLESDPALQVGTPCNVHIRTGLTAGSNTFTSKYRVSGGTGNFEDRRITVIPA